MAIDDIRSQIRAEIARLQAALNALDGNVSPEETYRAQERVTNPIQTQTEIRVDGTRKRRDSPLALQIRSLVMQRTHADARVRKGQTYLKKHPKDSEAKNELSKAEANLKDIKGKLEQKQAELKALRERQKTPF